MSSASPTIRTLGVDDLAAFEAEVARARSAGELRGSSDPGGSVLVDQLRHGVVEAPGAFDASGALVGFVSPEVKAVVVRPDHRRRGVGRALIDAAEGVERRRGRAQVIMGVTPDDASGLAFLRATGFAYHSTLWDLELPADAAVPEPAWPAGCVARSFERDRDGRDWIILFNAAFADHATPLQIDLEPALAEPPDPRFVDADTHLLADAVTGRLLGFCATTPEREDGVVGPSAEIWTIGVRPSEQGRGLGRQLLRWGIQRLRGLGVSDVHLSVNSMNEGALGLYEREGFRRVRTRERWSRPVSAPG